ncbi:alpha/beta-hydrolase [Epithele typhae]|uniref:alpha/beta-hydrolase n=1 Tax=Epithele typhae TaxID=378194 RepID=UPI0020082A0C|nr:alpha/beta-hydrolase [Epithele typhae]KAH9927946.1 alpha/beta-hydrolase [Epithele typhae]
MAPIDPNSTTFTPPDLYELPSSRPQPLLPLRPPPLCIYPPVLPSPPRKSLLDATFALSTHLVPAAWPRTTPEVPLLELPTWTPDKDAFRAAVRKTTTTLMQTTEEHWKGELDALPRNERPMWSCVNRYVRKGLKEANGVTLFCAHANGFSKELWEPALLHLVSRYSSIAKYAVDEIWSFEAANHGDSCLINEPALGGIFNWKDNSRDILHFLKYYLPAVPDAGTLPTHLLRLDATVAHARREHGILERRLVFMGHSFGGCSVVRAALAEPALFKTLLLVDPILSSMGPRMSSEGIADLVLGAVARRDGWSSREEAHRQFAAVPFFQAWDPAALDVYVECALYDAPDGQVRLKMPGGLEAANFAERFTACETFELLPQLDPRIETRFVIAGKLEPQAAEQRRRAVWRRTENTSHIRILSSGHLIPQEKPGELAAELHGLLMRRDGSQKARL